MHDDDVEQMRIRVIGWRDRALDLWEEGLLRIEPLLPKGWVFKLVATVLVLITVGVFFAIDGRLPWWMGLGITVAYLGASIGAGFLASRYEPVEEDTSDRDADLRSLIAAYGGDDDGSHLDDTVDLDPGDRDARFAAFMGAVVWLHLPWIVVYVLGVVLPAVTILPIGERTQAVAIGCTVMPALAASSLLSWAVWSRAVVRGAIRSGVRPARVLTNHIAIVGMVCLTLSSVWGLVGASPWSGSDSEGLAETVAGEDDEADEALPSDVGSARGARNKDETR